MNWRGGAGYQFFYFYHPAKMIIKKTGAKE